MPALASKSWRMSAWRCASERSVVRTYADESVMAAPNPAIDWYVCVTSTSIVGTPPSEPAEDAGDKGRDACLASKWLASVVVNQTSAVPGEGEGGPAGGGAASAAS